ncbi:hypothetical protein RRF57_006006 [Xylaria bambusicola]|uniref:Mitochondrial transcription factor 1 n=1 Tax=Xylaria bambusicola TaxID=326684 RepID=A0AAN7Z9K8_9PEZI
MFTVRSSHGRALYSPLFLNTQRCLFSSTCRRSAFNPAILEAHGPVAEQLHDTGIWTSKRRTRPRLSPPPAKKRSSKAESTPDGDRSRVNIVSDKLCDDILSYIGSSLERHRGCDILDLYPGAGLWSSKLHQFLQPRSHVLLEPDAELYHPFLQPLLDQPGTTLVPKSGIIWRELGSILTPEYFPHQVIPDDLNTRNDTLLVTANLCFHPKKKFLRFDSVAALVLSQLVDAIRTSSLFQQYGLVRMLIWTSPDDKASFLPKTIQKRKRQAIANDFVCEWVHEVCGSDSASTGWYVREDAIDHGSLIATIKRMKAANLKMPAGRESDTFADAFRKAEVSMRGRVPSPGVKPPTFKRRYHGALADLVAANEEQGGFDKGSLERKELKRYAGRAQTDVRKAERLFQVSKSLDNIINLRQSVTATREEMAAAELEWETQLRELPSTFGAEFVTYRDNLHAFRRDPPLLQWDRRPYEPLMVQPEEVFPNVPCALLDIQPRAPHPLLRQSGPSSNRAADSLDIVLGTLMHYPTHPVAAHLDGLWPGAADYIMPRWKSSSDLSQGGWPINLRGAEPTPRSLDARQWEELFELWMEWPFRPEFYDLVGRAHDDLNDKDDDAPSMEY